MANNKNGKIFYLPSSPLIFGTTPMLINADFSRRAIVVPDQYQWVSSPQDGVEGVMLGRVSEEKARDPATWQHQDGRELCPLFSGKDEQVSLQRLAAGEPLFTDTVEGAELLVLAGALTAGEQTYERGSWIRLPTGDYPEFVAGTGGVTLYLKTGHLADMAVEVQA